MRKLGKAARSGLAIALSVVMAVSLCACGAAQKAADDEEESAEEEVASFNAHGSEYGKAERVNVSSDLQGNLGDIAVEETIANPDEKATITDESKLNAISFDSDDLEGVSYTQDGNRLTWTTAGKDITYTGTTTQELPISLSYSYKLDGKTIAPEDIGNVSGKLQITIKYANNSSAKIKVNGETKTVKLPYMFATLVTLDPEHARNVEVEQGTCVSMNGQQIAVGIAAPDLQSTLELTDDDLDLGLDLGDLASATGASEDDSSSLDLGELDKVTITADVAGFTMPSITTMATDSLLSNVAGNMDSLTDKTDGVFSSLGNLVSAIGKIGTANATIAQAVGKISSGTTTASSNLPTLAEGLGNMSTLASGIQTQAQTAGTALSSGTTDIDSTLETLNALLQDESLTADQRSQLQSAVDNLTSAKQTVAQAAGILTNSEHGTVTMAGNLATGLSGASSGITQLSTGISAISTAMGKLSAGLATLGTGSTTMSKKLSSALTKVQELLTEHIDLIEALGDCVEDQGAYCGSASDMPASTIFTVTAKAAE